MTSLPTLNAAVETDSEPVRLSIEHPVIVQLVRRVARNVALNYNLLPRLDVVDLEQLGFEFLLSRDDLRECMVHDRLGQLHYRLGCDLANIAVPEMKYQIRTGVSYDDRHAEPLDDELRGHPRVRLAVRDDEPFYSQDLVEALLPVIWDESFCWGLRTEQAPDPDMPRGSVNMSTMGVFWAHLADVRIAWERADLSQIDRQALFLAYGPQLTQTEIALVLGVSQKSVSNYLARGKATLLDYLNGRAPAMAKVVVLRPREVLREAA